MQSLPWKGRLFDRVGASSPGDAVGPAASSRFLPLLYLAICIPTVLFLVFFRQPLGNPDELSHVARAYQLSKGVLLTEDAKPGLHPRGMVEESWFKLGSEVTKRRFESLDTALPVFQEFRWSGTERLRRFNSSVYFPVPFIPQAVGLKIAQKLDLPLVQSLQLASMLNAIVCLLIIALAVHLAAEGKFLIAMIGTLPMSVHQLASASPDGIVIAGSLLMFALTVTAVVRSEVRFGTLVGVTGLGVLAAATKLPYLPVALAALAALWWADRQSSGKNLKYVLASAVMIGLAILWAKISNASAVRHSLRLETNPEVQIAFLLSHPLEIPSLAVKTLYAFWDAYLAQIIGILGWLDARLYPAVYPVLGVGLAAILVMDSISIKPRLRWAFSAALAMSIALIFLSLYLIWNPLGWRGPIEGVQGRYFLPILPFLLFLIPKPERHFSDRLKLSIFTVCGIVGGAATWAAIIKRYYS